MKMKIYIATGNFDKKREMAELLPEHTVVTPKDEGIGFNPEETGESFYENSLIKARSLWELVHSPVIADDSGLCVDALGGAPGIYSSRYAGPAFMQGRPDDKKIAQAEQNKFLIEQLNAALAAGLDEEAFRRKGLFAQGPRSAHYTCAMVLYLGHDRLLVAQETMEGCIVPTVEAQRGTGGFGYDPLFYLPAYGKTVAELSGEEKNKISHRGKAERIIKNLFFF